MMIIVSTLNSNHSNELISRCVSKLIVVTRCDFSKQLDENEKMVQIIHVEGLYPDRKGFFLISSS